MISAIAIDMINHWYCYRPYLGMVLKSQTSGATQTSGASGATTKKKQATIKQQTQSHYGDRITAVAGEFICCCLATCYIKVMCAYQASREQSSNYLCRLKCGKITVTFLLSP